MLCARLRLLITNVVAGSALVVLIMMARHPSAITMRKLWKNKVYYLQILEITWDTWGHAVRWGRESWGGRLGEGEDNTNKSVGLEFCIYRG